MSFHRSRYFYREHDQATLSQHRLSHIQQTKSCRWKMEISPGIMQIVYRDLGRSCATPTEAGDDDSCGRVRFNRHNVLFCFHHHRKKTVTMTLKGPDRASIFKGRWYGGYFQTHAALFTDECSRALKIRSPVEDKNDSLHCSTLDTAVLQRVLFNGYIHTQFINKISHILSKMSLGRIWVFKKINTFFFIVKQYYFTI